MDGGWIEWGSGGVVLSPDLVVTIYHPFIAAFNIIVFSLVNANVVTDPLLYIGVSSFGSLLHNYYLADYSQSKVALRM